MLICPWCGLKASELTCSGDASRRFLCSGGEHEWLEGEEPSEPKVPEQYWTPDVTEGDK